MEIEKIVKIVDEVVAEWDYEGEDLESLSIVYDEGKNIEFGIVEEGKWEDEGKYQYQDNIYQIYLTEKNDFKNSIAVDLYYQQSVERSGSYFSHYEFTYNKPVQVELHEYLKTIAVREWVEV